MLAPLVLQVLEKPEARGQEGPRWLEMLCGAALAPLFRADFVESLPEADCFRCRASWRELQRVAPVGTPMLAADLVLRAFALRFGDQREADELTQSVLQSGHVTFNGHDVDLVVLEMFRRPWP